MVYPGRTNRITKVLIRGRWEVRIKDATMEAEVMIMIEQKPRDAGPQKLEKPGKGALP